MTTLIDWLKAFFQGTARLTKDSAGNPTTRELQVATVVLLLEMASIDGDVTEEEVSSIVEALDQQFDLTDTEAMKLLMAGYKEQERRDIIGKFIEELNDSFSVKQKQVVMSLLHQVLKADGKVCKEEKELFEVFKAAFSLSDNEVAEAIGSVGAE